MFNRLIVQEALRRIRTMEKSPGKSNPNPAGSQDRVISMLIHDIYGGEILKTHNKKGWHFYNRIDGERVDFSSSKSGKLSANRFFEDLPSSADETQNYFEREDYATFFMKFIWAFEEVVGLEKHQFVSPA